MVVKFQFPEQGIDKRDTLFPFVVEIPFVAVAKVVSF